MWFNLFFNVLIPGENFISMTGRSHQKILVQRQKLLRILKEHPNCHQQLVLKFDSKQSQIQVQLRQVEKCAVSDIL